MFKFLFFDNKNIQLHKPNFKIQVFKNMFGVGAVLMASSRGSWIPWRYLQL